jgi:hypothetical protein
MEIVAFQEVAIDNADEADSSPDELVGDDAAEGAAAADERSGRRQSTLTILAEWRESHLATVAIEL